MTHANRRLPIPATLVMVALAAVACGPGASSVTPSSPASPSLAPTSTPFAAPTASPIATSSAIPSPSAATACVVAPQTGELPSDRFTDLKVSTGATADRLTFVFGNPSLPGPPSPPQGSLDAAHPPYTQAGSGATIVVTGDHVIQVRFTGMSLQNDAGQETFTGQAEIKPALPALRHAVLFDASEGVVGWYIGYDGMGCVTLGRDGNNVTVTIAHS